MSFETLPQHNLNIPEFHPVNVPPPPVTNTTEMIAPLLNLAHYLSPTERAKRKAAVAKANYEYRLYSGSGDPRLIKDPFFMWKLQGYNDKHKQSLAYIDHINSLTHGKALSGPPAEARRRWKLAHPDASPNPNPGIDMNSESMPPPPSDDTVSDSTANQEESSSNE